MARGFVQTGNRKEIKGLPLVTGSETGVNSINSAIVRYEIVFIPIMDSIGGRVRFPPIGCPQACGRCLFGDG